MSPISTNALPAIVAGPIVRRLTDTDVAVWVALSRPDAVTLRVRQAGQTASQSSAPVAPVRVGTHLWITVLTCSAPNGAFQPEVRYEYWLEGAGIPAVGDAWWRDTIAISGDLPTFVGLPTDVADFRMLHASCRKPHGGRRDGLSLALAQLRGDRPHLMVLSGDQIYADDVASCFFACIVRVAEGLIGIDEGGLFPPALVAGRQAASDAAGFTGEVSKDHLWKLEEFLAHYLLSWSDVLWPEQLPAWPGDPHPEVQGDNDQQDAEIWAAEVDEVERFRSTLPDVRRVLANVPVLMMFDDHEITDDWNINGNWCTTVYASPQGRRIVSNGLLAAAICQFWGNDPARFAPGTPGGALLAQMGGTTSPISATVEAVLGVPPASTVPPGGAPLRTLDASALRYDLRLGPADGYPVNLVLLDERTARFLPGASDAPAGRIHTAALDLMWPSPSPGENDVPSVVVAPAPVLGMHGIEHIVQPLTATVMDRGAVEFDFEGWSGHGASFLALLHRAAEWGQVVFLSGDVHFGYTKCVDYQRGPLASRAVQLVASSSKYAVSKTTTLHLFGDALTKLDVVRERRFVVYDTAPGARVDVPTGSLPWDEWVDVLLGRPARELTRSPCVLSAEIAQGYDPPIPGTPDATFTIAHIDDETFSPPTALRAAMTNTELTGWRDWNAEKSIDMVRALRASDLHRIGRVFVGQPQLAVISFPPGHVHQALHYAVGDDASAGQAVTATQVALEAP